MSLFFIWILCYNLTKHFKNGGMYLKFEKKNDEYKYKIIEPFFKKEKKLKEIEVETDISYATLKRWVTQYKNFGISGLQKKSRVDKDTSKKLSDEALIQIKKMYKEFYNLPVTKLYEKAKKIMTSCNSMVSYPTFFRIINNLDKNIKKSSINSIKVQDIYEYGIIQKGIPIPFFNNENRVYYLTVFYNKDTYNVVNFIFEEKEREFENLFNFLYTSIVKDGNYPKNISVDLKIKGVSKKIEKTIFFKSGINIIQEEYLEDKEMFLTFVGLDILREFNRKYPKDKEEIVEFLKTYFFLTDNILKKERELEGKDLERLSVFLKKYTRKVYSVGVRVKNSLYFCDFLKEYEDKIVQVAYNEFDADKVQVYYEEKYIGHAKLK